MRSRELQIQASVLLGDMVLSVNERASIEKVSRP
jgi:hypothetical protein